MRVGVAGTGSAVGEVVVPWLRQSGHEVLDVTRPLDVSAEVDELAAALVGCDAVVHLVGAPAALPTGLPRRRSDGRRVGRVQRLTRAAELAGVRRLLVTSSSLLYADQGSAWVTEESPVCVTTATEPASESEHLVQRFASAPCRHGVVLRMGLLLGDSPLARWSVRTAGRGRPVSLGDPDGFVHVLHSDDVGPAVTAALTAPSGTYNVGAAPVRRGEVLEVLASAAGRSSCRLLGPLHVRWAGPRAEPLGRSLRVSSELFRTRVGWHPSHDRVTLGWFRPDLQLTGPAR